MAKGDQSPELLRELQAMPMEAKVLLTQARLDEFWTGYNTIGWGNAYISFSGGKDSTVLLDIARKRYPDIPAVFSNTGLEYPEIRQFAQSHDNVETVHPKMRFDEVISRYGYPLIGKEVAEAIYYARRITSAERERERGGGRICEDNCHELQKTNGGTGKQADWKRQELRGGSSEPHPDERREKSQNGPPRPMGRNRSDETFWKRIEITGQYPGKRDKGLLRRDRTGVVDITTGGGSQESGTCGNPHNGRAEEPRSKSRGETDWSNWRRGCL